MTKRRRRKLHAKSILELQQELDHTKNRIETVRTNYEFVIDPDLIDSYIYETNAAWKRYHFLLRQVRQITSASMHLS